MKEHHFLVFSATSPATGTYSGYHTDFAKKPAQAYAKAPGREIDYSDYRDAAGVKWPFKWTAVWTDGQSEFERIEIKPNVAIDASTFEKPTPTPSVPNTTATP